MQVQLKYQKLSMGLGIAIVSTSRGLMTDKQGKKREYWG
jgi:ribosomal protein S8